MEQKQVEEILNRLNDEMARGVKDLLAHDLWPNTLTFTLAKMAMQDRIIRRHGLRVGPIRIKDYFRRGYYKVFVALLLNKFKLFRNQRFIVFLDQLKKSPLKLRPKWYYKMGAHKFLMNEGDASMREILRDYVAVGDRVTNKKEDRVWELETTRLVEKWVKPGDICLDIGASVGYFTLLFSRLVGKMGKVLSFEPTTNQIPYITENVRVNGYTDRVRIYHMGAFDVNDVIEMPVHAPIKYKVKVGPVDDVLEAEGIMTVDFIKIDVDGVEPKVLKGLQRTIERSKNLKMVIEYYPKYLIQAGCDPKEFMDLINKYFTYEVIPGDYSGECENLFCTRR